MFKVIVLIALAVAGAVQAQELVPPPGEAAPEPYAYAYETDSHAAAEQRDPSGKVTGFYTLADADGRQRRVEYIADEGGFRAKVATNELGTKSENPAHVEVLASPPTEAQLVYTAAAPQVARQQQVTYQAARAPAVASSSYAVIPQPGYSAQYSSYYQPGYAYGNQAFAPGYGYGNGIGYGYGNGYGYGYGNARYGNAAYYSNYNTLPAQYYKSVQTTGAPAVAAGVRYVQQPGASLAVGNYRSFGVGPATSSIAYTTGSRTVAAPSADILGSSNYIVLKKRAAAAAAASSA